MTGEYPATPSESPEIVGVNSEPRQQALHTLPKADACVVRRSPQEAHWGMKRPLHPSAASPGGTAREWPMNHRPGGWPCGLLQCFCSTSSSVSAICNAPPPPPRARRPHELPLSYRTLHWRSCARGGGPSPPPAVPPRRYSPHSPSPLFLLPPRSCHRRYRRFCAASPLCRSRAGTGHDFYHRCDRAGFCKRQLRRRGPGRGNAAQACTPCAVRQSASGE